jgi:hypothetical protein
MMSERNWNDNLMICNNTYQLINKALSNGGAFFLVSLYLKD